MPTPMFEGQGASQVLQSAVSMEAGVTDVLETMKTPENRNWDFPKNVVGLSAQLKCTSTDAHSVVTNRRRSMKPLCTRDPVTSLPAQRHVG